MKLKPKAATGSHFRPSLWLGVMLPAALATLSVSPALAAGLEDLIGGNEVIPINPDFNPRVELKFEGDAIGNEQVLNDQIFNLLGTGTASFAAPNVVLGAALSSSLSASNRPSVLTPYAGIIVGEGEDAVFDTFGSLSANKATTLGRGKLGLGLSYQHAKFDEFDGKDIGRVFVDQRTDEIVEGRTLDTDIIPGVEFQQSGLIRRQSRITASDVEFTADVVTLSITYGLLDNLDVGALIPYIWLNTRGKISADISQEGNVSFLLVDTKGDDDPSNDEIIPDVSTAGSFKGRRRTTKRFDRDFEGLGDIILFGKLQVVSEQGLPNRIQGPVDVAVQLEVKLPTGDEDDFLGTGETDVALRTIVQKQVLERLILRGEVGYNYSGLGSSFSSWDLKAGAEFQISPDLTTSLEVISNISDEFDAVTDAIVGAKYVVSRDFKVFAGLRVPLNDNGLRFRYSPIVGAEYTFSPRSSRIESERAIPASQLDELPAEPVEMQSLEAEPLAPTAPAGAPVEAAPAAAAPIEAAPAPAAAPPAAPAAAGESGSLTLEPTESKDFNDGSAKAKDQPSSDPQPGKSGDVQPLPLPSGRN